MAYTVKPIDEQKTWEGFIAAHAPGSLFQSWLWGDVLGRTGELIGRFGLFDGTELVGIASVAKVSARRGTYLHIRHGPIFRTQSIPLWRSFLDFARSLAKKEHAWFVRVSPLIPDNTESAALFRSLRLLPAAIHAMDAELCWVLDIDKPEDELLSGMRKSTRYDVKRAEKIGVDVRISEDLHDLKTFLRIYGTTARRHGFVPHAHIREEFAVFGRIRQAILLFGRYRKETLACALVLFYGPQAIYHHGASVPTKLPVSAIIQWQAIREAKKRGLKVYNFWGIAPENNPKHPWRGLTLFKTGFGGRSVASLHAHDFIISPLYVIPRIIEETEKRLKRY